MDTLLDLGPQVLIFFQMTRMMDIVEDYLTLLRGWKCCRIDGQVSFQERQERLKAFEGGDDEDYFVFLLSTRAGGLGISLPAADTVIIYDSDFNPQQVGHTCSYLAQQTSLYLSNGCARCLCVWNGCARFLYREVEKMTRAALLEARTRFKFGSNSVQIRLKFGSIPVQIPVQFRFKFGSNSIPCLLAEPAWPRWFRWVRRVREAMGRHHQMPLISI